MVKWTPLPCALLRAGLRRSSFGRARRAWLATLPCFVAGSVAAAAAAVAPRRPPGTASAALARARHLRVLARVFLPLPCATVVPARPFGPRREGCCTRARSRCCCGGDAPNPLCPCPGCAAVVPDLTRNTKFNGPPARRACNLTRAGRKPLTGRAAACGYQACQSRARLRSCLARARARARGLSLLHGVLGPRAGRHLAPACLSDDWGCPLLLAGSACCWLAGWLCALAVRRHLSRE